MKRFISVLSVQLIFVLNIACHQVWAGVPGIPDRVPAATLIVPFFEVGVNATAHPEDTLLVISNNFTTTNYIHYHVWTIDGEATDLNGNFELEGAHSEDFSMRALIEAASQGVKDDLLVNSDYYRGFVTFDLVSSPTSDPPTASGYPFTNSNYLTGYIYYTRLTEGSSNGLSMIPLEYVGSSVHSRLRDFYMNSDRREEIGGDARACAENSVNGGTCSAHSTLSRIYGRIFTNSSINAKTRFILFSWYPGFIGGPSVYCDSHSCSSVFSYYHYGADGSVVESDTTKRFDHVINIMEFTGDDGGFISVWDLENADVFQTYAFSINSANPSELVNGFKVSWDAIFEAFLIP